VKFLLALALLLQGTTGPVRAPAVTARVTPEQPAIGEPITVELRVRAPAGSDVRFPVLPDTGTRIEPLDPRAMRDASTATYLDRTAVYRFIAWDTGRVTLSFGDVTVRRDGAEQRFPVSLAAIVVRSVLPVDTTLRVPRAARPPLDASSMRWRLWLALAVLAALLVWGWRRWRRRRASRAVVGVDSAVRARERFAHIRTLDLIGAGEPGRHALAHVSILRHFLADRWPELPASMTAAELAERMPHANFPILPERVTQVVVRTEALAYARAAISASDAERIGIECASIVEDLEKVWQARRQAAAEATGIKRRPLK
jgi:hypothetical protein